MPANDTADNNFQTSSLSIADLKRAVAQVSAVFSDPSQLNIAIRENLSDSSSVLRNDLTLDDLTLVLELDSIDLIISSQSEEIAEVLRAFSESFQLANPGTLLP